MMRKYISLLVLACLLCSMLLSCAEVYRPIEPTEEEARQVASIGEYAVLYDELRFVCVNTKQGLTNAYGVDWSDAAQAEEYAEELESSVRQSLLRNYAVTVLFEEAYGGEASVDDMITEQMEAIVKECGGMDGYRKYLAENAMTDRLVRFNLAVSLKEYELLSYYTELGLIDGSESAMAEFFFGDGMARTMHICLEGTGDSQAALAEELCARIEAGEDVFTLAAEYSTDYAALGDGGEYIMRGDYVEEYENIAFRLEVGEADFVAVGDKTYVICALEKDMMYFLENYDAVYYGYLYSELDSMVERQCKKMSVEKTELGEALKLWELN